MSNTLKLAGAALAALLFTLPALAENQNPASQQAAPSPKPASQARAGAVAPGQVGIAPKPGPNTVGTAQASPSPTPAPETTPGATHERTAHPQSQ
jgi:hypothetical protein